MKTSASTVRNYGVMFAAILLLGNASVGDRGLLETIRARRAYAALASDLARIRQDNVRLRDEVRRLRSDPATIEDAARRELGLVRPGEFIVNVKN